MKVERILIGIDESPTARPAVDRGVELARRFDAALELVHCVPLENEAWAAAAAMDWHALRDDVVERRRARMLEVLAEWCPTPPPGAKSVEDALVLLEQKPHRALASYAEEKHADLIVLGGHERRGVFDFGGTARSLLHFAHCAVWTQPSPPAEIRTILAPLTPDEMTDAAFDWMRSLARSFDARLVLLNVFEPPAFAYEPHQATTDSATIEKWKQGLERRFREFAENADWGVETDTRFVEGDPTDVILRACREADLVTMGTHARGVLGRAVLGSVAYGVLKGAEIPSLLVPNRAGQDLESPPAA